MVTWPLDTLLRYLCSLPPPEGLGLAMLSKNTATLIRLSTNARSSLLCLLSRQPIFEDNKITFPLIGLEKQSRLGHVRGWVSCAVTHNDSLNVAHHVRVYLQRTDKFLVDTDQLFLSISVPHKPVTTATTFAKWTLDLMASAGIDTNVFKTHSTRSAVPANLRAKTLSLDQILKRTDWASDRTFNTFYCKQVATEETLPEGGVDVVAEADRHLGADPLLHFPGRDK